MVLVNSCGHEETMLVCGSGQQLWSGRDNAGLWFPSTAVVMKRRCWFVVPVNSCGHVETMLVCGSGQQLWSCSDDAGLWFRSTAVVM